MNMKRFLFLLTNEVEINEFLKLSKSLDEKYPHIEKDVVYIKDIMKYDIFPLTIQGMGVSANTNLLIEDYLKLEDDVFEKYKEKLSEGNFRKIYSLEGEIVEVAMEELKAYDLLVVCRTENGTISDNLHSLLKQHYKPMLILSITDKEYSFDNVLMLNDGGFMVNRTVYDYFDTFGVRDIDVLRVNVEDRNRLTERFGSNCNIIDRTGDEVSIILSEVPKYDLILMGVLKYSIIFERLTGQVGLKVFEKTETPIYMG
ncbi:hypothetical protein STFE110948_03790 [Streptobacillus felis]|uniref:GntR family transcriptional regulator n=1 Tax=Streptobacillus felis TaxID=1384509 RepID=A0A7Z0PEZ7_9FUSO|nr:hypothetical protein [Streptobacillus felis]NYV28044.1 GntR family transcriptional regulator [Streptobacillus felis]